MEPCSLMTLHQLYQPRYCILYIPVYLLFLIQDVPSGVLVQSPYVFIFLCAQLDMKLTQHLVTPL